MKKQSVREEFEGRKPLAFMNPTAFSAVLIYEINEDFVVSAFSRTTADGEIIDGFARTALHSFVLKHSDGWFEAGDSVYYFVRNGQRYKINDFLIAVFPDNR